MAFLIGEHMKVISRKEAKDSGLKRYFTGGVCKFGHVSERLVSNGQCLTCASIKSKLMYHKDIDKSRMMGRERQSTKEHKEKVRAYRDKLNPEIVARRDEKKENSKRRHAASDAGLKKYERITPCQKCGTTYRFVSDSTCVECNRVSCSKYKRSIDPLVDERVEAEKSRRAKKKVESELATKLRRMSREAKDYSKKNGILTFISAYTCAKCGTNEKYTSSSSCVACSKHNSRSRGEYYKVYYNLNKDWIFEKAAEYRRVNSRKIAEKARAWSEKNPEKRKFISMTYKHKRREIERSSGMRSSDMLAWAESMIKECFYCGCCCDESYHIDHYIPLSKGGKHEIENLRISCPTCNLRKSAKMPEDFMLELSTL